MAIGEQDVRGSQQALRAFEVDLELEVEKVVADFSNSSLWRLGSMTFVGTRKSLSSIWQLPHRHLQVSISFLNIVDESKSCLMSTKAAGPCSRLIQPGTNRRRVKVMTVTLMKSESDDCDIDEE